MEDYTISQLIALGRNVATYMEEKLGYTSCSFLDITLRKSDNHKVYVDLIDDFQNDIPSDRRYKVGYLTDIPLDGIWDTLRRWPNREQRELEIMAQKLASIDANMDQITSAQVLAFVARLQPQIDEIRAMLTYQPDVAVDVETALAADTDEALF